jgi:hypothetical protein
MNRRQKNKTATPSGGARSGARDAGEGLRFTAWTAILGGAGVIIAVLGFYLLAQESITVAPFLLLFAFLVLFPLALVK